MALLKLASSSALFRQLAPSLCRAASSAPTVYDKLVHVTVVDLEGRRHVLTGLEGQTLVELLAANAPIVGEDAIALNPEGRESYEAHVKVPTELAARFPLSPDGDEALLLQVAAEDTIDKHSRLASRIRLTKDLDNMLVALGENQPWKTL